MAVPTLGGSSGDDGQCQDGKGEEHCPHLCVAGGRRRLGWGSETQNFQSPLRKWIAKGMASFSFIHFHHRLPDVSLSAPYCAFHNVVQFTFVIDGKG